jgi:hypothetical protein
MRLGWVFFHDFQGLCQWTRYDEAGLVIDESQYGFGTMDACIQNAVEHGYMPPR